MIENKSQLKNGDVVLSSKGSIGIVYKIYHKLVQSGM